METAEIYMQRCLELAKKGLGNTAPNPMVGAVLVYNNKIIGEGFTSKYGGNHAEVNCINSVKPENKKYVSKATLYVSLEPCSHFGKTPPCSNLIVENKIPKVVIGTLDTNKLVSGKGVKHLKENGIEVKIGVLQKECLNSNNRFFTFHNNKRPYIILKWAKSKDNFIGKLEKDKVEPIWISNSYSQQLVHLWRSQEQAILVGTSTVLSDNPSLTTRKVYGKNPIRIVLDKTLKIPRNFKVLDDSTKTIVLTEKAKSNTVNTFYEIIDFSNLLSEIIRVLHKHEIQSVIIEGGKQTLETFINTDLWDEARVFIGDNKLNNGVKSPILKNNLLTEMKKIEKDILVYYERRKKKLNNSTIKNIVFDFGGVILNLDKEATKRELQKLGLQHFDNEMLQTNNLYEKGVISTFDFLDFYQKKIPNTTKFQLEYAWNSILLDLPDYRLDFLEKLAEKYNLYLLSNINDLHLKSIKNTLGEDKYIRFIEVFDMLFYSHLIKMRKPDKAPFQFVLNRNNLKAAETLFIDDIKENCETAKKMGFRTWHFNPDKEELINIEKYL